MHFPDSNVLRGLKGNLLKTIVCLFVLLIPAFSQAQTVETTNRILEKIANYNNRKPLEKVHLHLNKNSYALEDTIWFQSYLVDVMNKPALTSKILFVDLIDAQDSICKSLEVPLKAGYGGGNYLALQDLKPGIYKLRAYTNLLKKLGTAYFFNKQIPVSAGAALLNDQKSTGQTPELRFFPEGGTLVSGIQSKIVVQLLHAADPQENYTASILDNDKNEVLKFQIPSSGIASFGLKPLKGKTYVAVIQPKGAAAMVYYLPKATDKGYTLAADNTHPDSLLVEMNASRDFPNGKEVIFVPFSGNRALFSFHTKFTETTLPLRLPKNTLADGIVKLIVFDVNGVPLAHTQVFINPKQLLSLKAEGLAPQYKTGSETGINFTATDEEGKAASGDFSVSVNKWTANGNALPTESYIVPNLLLSPDLNNTLIAERSNELAKMSPENAVLLNDLLLASDTKKMPWAEMINTDPALMTAAVQDTVFINGTVLRPNREPKKYAVVTLGPAGTSETGHFIKTTSDEKGRFKLAIPDGYLQEKFAIRAKADNILYRVLLDEPETYPVIRDTLYTARLNPEKPVDVKPDVSVAEAPKATVQSPASSVETSATPAEVPQPQSNSKNLNGFGKADRVLTAKDIQACPSAECFAALLPGVYGKNGNLYQVPDSGMKSKGAIRILLDGQVTTLSSLIPKDIKTIEFLKSTEWLAAYGSKGIPGVLVVTTLNSSPVKSEPVKTVPVAKAAPVVKIPEPIVKDAITSRFELAKKEGDFQMPLQLPSESFEEGTARSAVQFSPSKSAVYWKSRLKAGSDGKFSIRYVNPVEPGKYSITVEGISSNGKICSKVFVYEVN